MRFATIPTKLGPFLCPEPLANQSTSLFPISKLTELPYPPLQSDFNFDPDLQAFFTGRLLLLDEIPFPLQTIQAHYLHGFIQYEKGITKEEHGLSCRRCGNQDKELFATFSCYRCKEECAYCRNCIMMGRISQCTPLIRWAGPATGFHVEEPILRWDGQLSELQSSASERVYELIGHAGEILVWAVCGSGKTEILFAGIEKALREGLRVCLATPRTDVVMELFPRFEQAFPNTQVEALYGGHSSMDRASPLVLSTTHQLFRFEKAFDVMIVDEVDAFPYSYDKTLQFAVEKACKDEAARIYLSATPSEDLLARVRRKELDVIHISKRFHGYPLPVPEFTWCGNWKKGLKKGYVPKVLTEWVKRKLDSGRQCFLFVPTVKVLNDVYECLKSDSVDFVHAEDPERKEKVNRFRKGEITMLITTTILERGVTVPEIDVAVFGADHEVFTSNAFVQISGRVGRSIEDPYGEVTYFHFGKTKAMASAKKTIEQHNSRSSREIDK
ncbi:DEAD/DEAH box helicase [Pseudalkalibacillus salsuginis]|uniref:DEAD/DEAH box helicase n=1 Tax=Pseudalkalibacillus salsuginis TaxID=2910972 RepID=UPI001F16F183|nr:DEAD/DEAH box helicase [Pseudalkalibacillus salsuginis]MCF6410142.1 DEAD/DEAH box helicase [Pseudalkalibacillus salsuginis]